MGSRSQGELPAMGQTRNSDGIMRIPWAAGRAHGRENVVQWVGAATHIPALKLACPKLMKLNTSVGGLGFESGVRRALFRKNSARRGRPILQEEKVQRQPPDREQQQAELLDKAPHGCK